MKPQTQQKRLGSNEADTHISARAIVPVLLTPPLSLPYFSSHTNTDSHQSLYLLFPLLISYKQSRSGSTRCRGEVLMRRSQHRKTKRLEETQHLCAAFLFFGGRLFFSLLPTSQHLTVVFQPFSSSAAQTDPDSHCHSSKNVSGASAPT